MDNIKVLMVDDESRMRKLVSDFLTRKGYIVIEAGDGEEALDRFYADKDISLVILDVMMYAGRLERILKCLLLCLQLRAMNQAN